MTNLHLVDIQRSITRSHRFTVMNFWLSLLTIILYTVLLYCYGVCGTLYILIFSLLIFVCLCDE